MTLTFSPGKNKKSEPCTVAFRYKFHLISRSSSWLPLDITASWCTEALTSVSLIVRKPTMYFLRPSCSFFLSTVQKTTSLSMSSDVCATQSYSVDTENAALVWRWNKCKGGLSIYCDDPPWPSRRTDVYLPATVSVSVWLGANSPTTTFGGW